MAIENTWTFEEDGALDENKSESDSPFIPGLDEDWGPDHNLEETAVDSRNSRNPRHFEPNEAMTEADTVITERRSSVIHKLSGEVNGQKLEVSALEHCICNVFDHSSEIVIRDVSNSQLFIGPCTNAVYITNCSGCTITVACDECFILDSSNCSLFLVTRRGVEMDGSSGISIAPFKGGYDELDQHLALCHIDKDQNNWKHVIDWSVEEGSGVVNYTLLDDGENLAREGKTDLQEDRQFLGENPEVSVLLELFSRANSAGIDVFRWFFHEKEAETEGRTDTSETALPLAKFEKALEGLVLAVCAAYPGQNLNESIMERVVVAGFCENATQNFRSKTGDERKMVELQRLLDHCRVVKKDKQMQKQMQQKKRRKRGEGGGEGSVRDRIEAYVRLHGTDDLLRVVNVWKWSIDGRYPCGNGGAGAGETISLAALRRALESIGIIDPSCTLQALRRFSRFLSMSKSVDTRTDRRVRVMESHGKARDAVDVKALIRWLNAVRFLQSGCKDHQRWADEKLELETARKEALVQQLTVALAGDVRTLEKLLLLPRRRALKRTIQLVDFTAYFPEWAVNSEAEAAVDAWMKTLGKTKAYSGRREEIYYRKLDVAKETLRTSVTAKVDLLQRYYKDLKCGNTNGSFTQFLRARESYMTRKKDTLREWEQQKRKEEVLRASDTSAFAVIDNVMKRMEKLVNQTSREQKLEGCGLTTCRSTRYLGLGLEACFGKLRRLQAQGQVLLSKAEFHEIFDNLLTQLVADPATARDAWALLRPVASSKQRLLKIATREERAKAVQEQREILRKNGATEIDEEEVDQLALELIQKKFEDDIYAKVGFVPISGESEKQSIVEAWQKQVKRERGKAVKAWVKSKKREQRRRRQDTLAQTYQARENRLVRRQQMLDRIKVSKNKTMKRKKLCKSNARTRTKTKAKPAWVDILDDAAASTTAT